MMSPESLSTSFLRGRDLATRDQITQDQLDALMSPYVYGVRVAALVAEISLALEA